MACSTCHDVHREGSFRSPGEFDRLEHALRDHADLVRVPQPPGWTSFGFEESFHRCRHCGQTWLLQAPDSPSRGEWSPIA